MITSRNTHAPLVVPQEDVAISERLRSLARLDEETSELRDLLPSLLPHLSPDRPLWFYEPHNDDGVFKAGAVAVDVVGLGFPAEHAVLFSGERSPGWPSKVKKPRRKLIRDDELQLMADILETKVVRLYVPCYYNNYAYNEEDVNAVCNQLTQRTPGAIVCAGGDDLHKAHRAARCLLADSLYRLRLDLPVISYPAVWGALVPNALHLFSQATADLKYFGCRAHPSQQLAADYIANVMAMDRAWLAVAGQLTQGHHAGLASTIPPGVAGVEVFRIDEFDPSAPRMDDPIVLVKGILAGHVDPRQFVRSANLDSSGFLRNGAARIGGTNGGRSGANGNHKKPR